MKAKRLLLCLLLSVMLTVTFIPTMAFANDSEAAPHQIVIANSEIVVEEGGAYAALDQGEVRGLKYDSDNKWFFGNEGDRVDLYINPYGEYGVDYVTVETIDAADNIEIEEIECNYDTDEECYYFNMPNISKYEEYSVQDYYVVVNVYFEGDNYGDYAITFDGISAFATGTDYEGTYAYASLGHGTIYTYSSYDPENKCFWAGGKYPYFNFWAECDSGWDVNTIQYSIDGGAMVNVDVDDIEICPPALTDGQDHAIKVYVTFKQVEVINSVNLTIAPPLCGTVIKGTDWEDTDRQSPQPQVTLPAGAKYELDGGSDFNYGIWRNANGAFSGTISGDGTYLAYIDLKPKAGVKFAKKCAVNVAGGKLITKDRDYPEWIRVVIEVKAVHNFKHIVNKAGFLKNGNQYDQCVGCGVIQNKAVIAGWGKYYVKAPKAVAGKKSFTVKWGKQSKANLKKFTGYQVRYSVKKSMAKAKMVKVKKTATSKTIKKLKKKTKYYVQVRTYTKKSGKLFYSKWSAKKTVKTK